MRASYGTTKYCMAFLRNQTCNDHNCMNLHEWGDEKDCFTKEDLTTLSVDLELLNIHIYTNGVRSKHTMKATETRAKTTIVTKKEGEDGAYIQTIEIALQYQNMLCSIFASRSFLGPEEQCSCSEYCDLQHSLLIVSHSSDKKNECTQADDEGLYCICYYR